MIEYGCRTAPPAMECPSMPLPQSGLVTLTEVMCFAIYNSAMRAEDFDRELDALLANGGADWGSEVMEALVSRVYEALADSVEDGEIQLFGVCIDQSSFREQAQTPVAVQLAEIFFPACGELIHDLCGNVLYQRSTIENPNVEGWRTWQNVALRARDAKKLIDRIARCSRGEKAKAAESVCRDWLKAMMEKSPQRSPKPKGDFQKECLPRFKGLSSRGFDWAWRTAIDATGANWSAAGRRSKVAR